MEAKFKLLENRYEGLSPKELDVLYKAKKIMFDKLMQVLNPVICGRDFLESPDLPTLVKLAHMDEFLDCPHCMAEYEEKLKAKAVSNARR